MTDRSGLSPHLAEIETVQLYCGGARCFVLRHTARDLVLRSHWLRRQRLVAHNAGFELGFIRNSTRAYRPPPGRPFRFRLDCSMQATGLLLGVEFGGGRSLAAAAKAAGPRATENLQVSDWAAPVLSAGQIAYAGADAIITWRLWPALVHRLQSWRLRASNCSEARSPPSRTWSCAGSGWVWPSADAVQSLGAGAGRGAANLPGADRADATDHAGPGAGMAYHDAGCRGAGALATHTGNRAAID